MAFSGISEQAPKPEYRRNNSPNEILNIKPDPSNGVFRPDVETYLKPKYIQAHKKLFEDGAIKVQRFTPSKGYNNGIIGNPKDKVAFVMPKSIGEKAIEASNGNPRELENLLGLDNGYLGDNPVIIDIPNPENVRIPSGNEGSAFEGLWKPGGYTAPGNIPESVIEEVPEGKYTWHSLN